MQEVCLVHVAELSLALRHNAHNPHLALPTQKHRR